MSTNALRTFQHYVFDQERADRAIRFIESCCYLSKGKDAGNPLKLRPWQRHIIAEIFGWIDPETGLRRYRKVFIFLPRKNGKSHLAAAIALYMLYGDGERGAEVILAANSREQASIVFNAAAGYVRQSPILQPLSDVVPSTKRIVLKEQTGILKGISADAPVALGLDISCCVMDEVAFASSRDLYDALTTASGGREQPLHVFITTAGWDSTPNNVGFSLYQYAKSVQDGTVIDPQFLPILFELLEDADWSDEENWKIANPALGDFLNIDEIRSVGRQAINNPIEQNKFLTFHCNRWVQSVAAWLDVSKWNALTDKDVDEELLREADLYVGLDLSSNTDVSALACLWVLPERRYYLRVFMFLPSDDLRNRVLRDHAPYDLWSEQKHLILTPGSEVDYSFIRKKLDEIAEQYTVKAVAYDPWHAHQFISELEQAGYLCVKVRQGHESLGEPTKEFAGAVTGGRINHDGNPMLAWMVGNVTTRPDANNNIVPDKKRSIHRIDGVQASIIAMAVGIRLGITGRPTPAAEFRIHVLG